NNAGINRDAMLHKLTEADWDTVIDVNLKGTFLCMQQAAIRMRIRGWAVAGCGAEIMGFGPSPATRRLMDRLNIDVQSIDLI
ncbi:SDR family NAD(P)-dependent oxidoreductase, partial [Klebsiella pneumoniae]|uniref:SDR family NAD(P)-dependent oxidoreductase n=1 Tax=Klebsiella pneumoniae TaxID=573 RepID=UPI0023814862